MKHLAFAILTAAIFLGCTTDSNQDFNIDGRYVSADGKSIFTVKAPTWEGKFYLKSNGKSDLGLTAPIALSGGVDSFYTDSTRKQVCDVKLVCKDSTVAQTWVSLSIEKAFNILEDGSLTSRKLDDLLFRTRFQLNDSGSANRYGMKGTVTDSAIDFYYGLAVKLQSSP